MSTHDVKISQESAPCLMTTNTCTPARHYRPRVAHAHAPSLVNLNIPPPEAEMEIYFLFSTPQIREVLAWLLLISTPVPPNPNAALG